MMNESSNIVITGLGVVSPIGIGKERFLDNIYAGQSGVKKISLFETGMFKAHSAAEVADFKPEDILGSKYIKGLDRSTNFICAAVKLALDDAGLELNKDNTARVGMVTATTISVAWNIGELSREIVQEGPQYVNPAIFPGTTINAPSSQAAIRFGIKGFNTTVSTGFTAGLDALRYAVDFIRAGRADIIIVSGVESISFQGWAAFYKMEFLAGINGEEVCCPFDKRRNGVILGEGAGVVVIETEENAKRRNAAIYARILGCGGAFDSFRSGKFHPQAKGLKAAMNCALNDSGMSKDDIDYISSSANSTVIQDKLETEAVKGVFGERSAQIPVSAIKSMLGESLSVGGVYQVISAAGSFQRGLIPATVNYKEKDTECGLDYVTEGARKFTPHNILINNFGPGGYNASAVISG